MKTPKNEESSILVGATDSK